MDISTIDLSWQMDLELIMRVIIAVLLGGMIGWERERHGVSAGIRTYGGIALGACVFGIVSLTINGADPSRVAAQVATGIGFLGGGVIFRQGDYVIGLTTAATLWSTAAIGLAVAFGMYLISTLDGGDYFSIVVLAKIDVVEEGFAEVMFLFSGVTAYYLCAPLSSPRRRGPMLKFICILLLASHSRDGSPPARG